MARFHNLTVTDLYKTIRDAVVVTLAPDEPAAFDFLPGQYLTFRRDFDGEELRRTYSICAGADDRTLQVGIKRVEGGVFSSWANADLRVGDQLEVMPPTGRFHTPIEADTDKHFLMFAGGSGITPILSILKTVLSRAPRARVTLVYANRALATIMFREEIEDLKNLHLGRLNVIHVLETDAQEIDLFTGRVDGDKCAALFERWIDIGSVDLAFICGPEPMMLSIQSALRSHGLADDCIKLELFTTHQMGRASAPLTPKALIDGVEAKIWLDGVARTVPVVKGQSVLEAARAQDLDAPFACRAGVCSTCRAKLIEGEVEMLANHALEDHEVREGYILTCQSHPITRRLVVDYDQ